MAYASWSVVFGEQPTAAKWNILGTNDASFHDGTGIDDNAIVSRHYTDASVLAEHRGQVAKVGTFTITATGSKVVTGIGFKPKIVEFLFLPNNVTSRAVVCLGATDGTNQYASAQSTSATPNSNGIFSTSLCILVRSASNVNYINASITSLDNDGFTLNVTAYDATYGNNFAFKVIA